MSDILDRLRHACGFDSLYEEIFACQAALQFDPNLVEGVFHVVEESDIFSVEDELAGEVVPPDELWQEVGPWMMEQLGEEVVIQFVESVEKMDEVLNSLPQLIADGMMGMGGHRVLH